MTDSPPSRQQPVSNHGPVYLPDEIIRALPLFQNLGSTQGAELTPTARDMSPSDLNRPLSQNQQAGVAYRTRKDMPPLNVFIKQTVIFAAAMSQTAALPRVERLVWLALAVGGCAVGVLLACSFLVTNFWLQPNAGLMCLFGWASLLATALIWARTIDREHLGPTIRR